VFESRVLRRIFGPKRDEVTGEWRKLHNEELRNLYSSPSVIRAIKSRRMRWAWHVARMGEKRNAYKLLVEFLDSYFKKMLSCIDMDFILAVEVINVMRIDGCWYLLLSNYFLYSGKSFGAQIVTINVHSY
jgi:hypothetical protein